MKKGLILREETLVFESEPTKEAYDFEQAELVHRTVVDHFANIPKLAYPSGDRLYFIRELLGGLSGVEPPVPIPNTEVKRSSADDT